jgi:hypothetical protein
MLQISLHLGAVIAAAPKYARIYFLGLVTTLTGPLTIDWQASR